MALSDDVKTALNGMSKSTGVPYEYLYAVMMTESGGNPNAHTTSSTEDSRGLFQVNVKAHPDANSSQLFNPTYNAKYMAPTLEDSYNDGKKQGLSGVALAQYMEKNGEKPQWTDEVANNVGKYYDEATGKKDSTADQTGSTTSSSSSDDSSSMLSGIQGIAKSIATFPETMFNFVKLFGAYIFLVIIILFAGYITFVKEK